MRDEVACTDCGARISASVARGMKGLCIICRAKRRNKGLLHMLYASLIDRVHRSPDGFSTLSDLEKIYYTVSLLRNEINNGGFHQYFFNSSGTYYSDAKKGLIAIEAIRTLELLEEAKETLFPGIQVPLDTRARREFILIICADGSRQEMLDELDKRFYADPDRITSRLEAFVRYHGLVAAGN